MTTIYEGIPGVPRFEEDIFLLKRTRYCVLIPIINEKPRIWNELTRAQRAGVSQIADIIILDGGSTDGCTARETLIQLGVSALLTKRDAGRQGAQLRMGIYWALQRGYDGVVTIDGNDKDSIEDVPNFLQKLDEGFDLVQGSRFIEGGKAVNTPVSRDLAVRLIHAPVISLAAGQRFTDTTNAYRAYSRRYLEHPKVLPLRGVFAGYELLAYLSVRATQLSLKALEIPVTRAYPKHERTPTKISPIRGNLNLMKVLFLNLLGRYKP